MSLINCEVCGGTLSEAAVTCVHCGHPRLVTKAQGEIKSAAGRGGKWLKKEWQQIIAVIALLLMLGMPFYLELIVN